jgi:DNA-binding CsgD family transcriptional regulator
MNNKSITYLSSLIDSLGLDSFGENLNQLMQSVISYEMSCMFFFKYNAPPVMLFDGYSESISRKTLSSYLKGGYLLDPFYVACSSNHPQGVWRMEDLAPDSFFSSEFVVSKDIHPCVSCENNVLVEEIGLISPITTESSIVFSMMRTQGSDAFHSSEIGRINEIFSIINSLIKRHVDLILSSKKSLSLKIEDDIEDQFIDFFNKKITPTQSQIAKLILRGHSVKSIAYLLKIKESTVKLHKSNIYNRLDILNQADLFRMLIDFLSQKIS